MLLSLLALFFVAIFILGYLDRSRAIKHTMNIAELIPDSLLVVNEDGFIRYANSNATELFGYTKKELYTMAVEDIMPQRFRHAHIDHRVGFHQQREIRPMGMGRDLYILRKDGKEVPAEIALSPAIDICLIKDKGANTMVLLHDITERKRIESQINRMAYFDQLTDIPNRASFYIESKAFIDEAIANEKKLAFIILDIRDLKRINDTLGHYTGDDVIQKTGLILKNLSTKYNCMCDCCEVMLAIQLYKISGNEFIFLIEYDDSAAYSDNACLDKFAEDVISEFKHPMRIDGTMLDIHIDVNLGISILSIHGVSVSQLLKTGDLALIKSKSQGTNTYCYYNDRMNDEFENFMLYENAIRYFIKTNDFDLSFQPVWSNTENKFVGAEVLFRCNNKIYPDMKVDFLINVAESTGLIVPLGTAILERACRVSKEQNTLSDGCIMSVNASIQQIEEVSFCDTVTDILDRTEFDPKNLAIEITETTLMNHNIQAMEKMNTLREQGICVYIDDFGKGYSSLAYLKDLPADKLKIDMSFLEGMEDSESSVEILRAIVHLGHAMEMIVCAEGVETKEQAAILKNLKCDELQGYFVGKPMPFAKLKKKHKDMFDKGK